MKKTMAAVCTALALTACSLGGQLNESARAESQWDMSEYFSDRDLAYDWESRDPVDMTLDNGSVTITEAGVYVLSGKIEDGSVTGDAADDAKVELVLKGVDISCSSSAGILVENADKVFITLADGTENRVACTGLTGEDGVDAAIFARDDIVFGGSGALTVVSPEGHGIVGKDDVKFVDGQYVIQARDRGIDANDSVRVAGGSFDITSGKDGIRAKNEEDEEKGYVILFGGEYDITAGGGAGEGETHRTDNWGWGRQAQSVSQDNSVSMKGIKASGDLTVLGGTYTIDSADDALHTDKDMTVESGSMTLSTGDDGMHADGTLTISGGQIDIAQSYEGIEGTVIDISGGEIGINASDDGLNAAGGSDQSGFGFRDMFTSDGTSSIAISGGTLYINASGDGIDSNGDLAVSGGTVVVSGSANSGNGALDYAGSASITGGAFIAAGASGMAQGFGNGSTQASAMVTLRGQAGEIQVKNAKGEVILSGTVDKGFDCVVVSCPEMAVGESYTVTSGASQAQVEMTGIVTGGMGMGGFGGGRQGGGFGGGMRGGMQIPQGGEDEGQMPPDGFPGGERDGGPQGGFPGGQQGGFGGERQGGFGGGMGGRGH